MERYVRSSEMLWSICSRVRGRDYDNAAVPHSFLGAVRTFSRSVAGESMARLYFRVSSELTRVQEEVEAAQGIRSHYQKQALRVEHIQEIDRLVARLNALIKKRDQLGWPASQLAVKQSEEPKSLLDEMDLDTPWTPASPSNSPCWARSAAIVNVQRGLRPRRSVTPAAIREMQREMQLLKATLDDMQPNMPSPEEMAQVKSASRMAKFNRSTHAKLEEMQWLALPLTEIQARLQEQIEVVTAEIKTASVKVTVKAPASS